MYLTKQDMVAAWDVLFSNLQGASGLCHYLEAAYLLREQAHDMGVIEYGPIFHADEQYLRVATAEYQAWYTLWATEGYPEDLRAVVNEVYQNLEDLKADITRRWCARSDQQRLWYDLLLDGKSVSISSKAHEQRSWLRLRERMTRAGQRIIYRPGVGDYYAYNYKTDTEFA